MAPVRWDSPQLQAAWLKAWVVGYCWFAAPLTSGKGGGPEAHPRPAGQVHFQGQVLHCSFPVEPEAEAAPAAAGLAFLPGCRGHDSLEGQGRGRGARSAWEGAEPRLEPPSPVSAGTALLMIVASGNDFPEPSFLHCERGSLLHRGFGRSLNVSFKEKKQPTVVPVLGQVAPYDALGGRVKPYPHPPTPVYTQSHEAHGSPCLI